MAVRSVPKAGEDRRSLRTRAALIRAGQALFAERSVDGVSVDDVVRTADVAKGSFYNHFNDKEALAREVATRLREIGESFIVAANAGVEDPAARVARALCVQMRYTMERPQEARASSRLFFGATFTDLPMNAGVTHDVKMGLDQGRFDAPSVQAGILLIMGVIAAGMAHAADQTDGFDPKLTEALGIGLLRALGVPEADAVRVVKSACAEILSQTYQLGAPR